MPIEELNFEGLGRKYGGFTVGSGRYASPQELQNKLNELIRWANDIDPKISSVLTDIDSYDQRIKDIAAHGMELFTWKDDHEKLTLPRLKSELIELFKDEEVAKALEYTCRVKTVSQGLGRYEKVLKENSLELQAAEDELSKAIELVLEDFGSQAGQCDVTTSGARSNNLNGAFIAWQAARRG